MIDRLLRRMIDLLVLLLVLAVLFGALRGFLVESRSIPVPTAAHVFPQALSNTLTTLLAGVFCIGLVVRLHRLVTGQSGKGGDRNGQRDRVRVAVRRAADDAPPAAPTRLPEDSDPALDEQEG